MCSVVLCISSITTGCGSEFEILLHEAPRPPVVFWSEASGEISRINPDGTGRKIILTSSYIPLDIAADSSNDRVFWTEHTGSSYQINRAGIDGSSIMTVYSYLSANGFGPSSIAVNKSGTMIFWNQYQNAPAHNDIWSSALDIDILLPEKWFNSILNKYTFAMYADSISDKIYFTVNSYYNSGVLIGSGNAGEVCMGNLGVFPPVVYLQKVTGTGPLPDSSPFRGIAVDGNRGYVYYASNTTSLRIMRSDLTISFSGEVWVDADGFDIQKIAIDFKQRKIYWTSESDKSIYRADLDSSNSNVEKFIDLESSPTGITILQ
jgi:hypothetical protein